MSSASMRIVTAVIALAFSPVFDAGAANGGTTAREWSVETDTIATSLPEVVPASISARTCSQCQAIDLRVTKDSQFFVNSKEVSLPELRKIARTRQFMMVFYKPATFDVTRIVVQQTVAK